MHVGGGGGGGGRGGGVSQSLLQLWLSSHEVEYLLNVIKGFFFFSTGPI